MKNIEMTDRRIFISSTFNDMHAERDYLVKNVFPQLGEWCERQHIMLSDIDLRWGVTADDKRTGNTIYKCLNAVDSCRPFFLCILGQRRGWIPSIEEINEYTQKKYPELPDMVREKSRSATEYEIEHALLAPLAYIENEELRRGAPDADVIFIRRRPDYMEHINAAQRRIFMDYDPEQCGTEEGYAAYLERCRRAMDRTYERVSKCGTVIDYDCRWDDGMLTPELAALDKAADRTEAEERLVHGRLTDFSVRTYDIPGELCGRLRAVLASEFPEELPDAEATVWPLKAYLLAMFAMYLEPYCDKTGRCRPDDVNDRYGRDAEQQKIFLSTCLKNSIMQADAERKMAEYCLSDPGACKGPMLVLAEAGMGKTTAMARFAKNYASDAGKTPESRLIVRFLGVSDMSGNIYSLWDSILHESGLNIPDDMETLKRELYELLAEMAPCVVMLDGLEQIAEGKALLDMIPAQLPAGVRMIISARTGRGGSDISDYTAFHREIECVRLRPLGRAQKEELIRTFLSDSLKEIDAVPDDHQDETYMDIVCRLDESGNPLYLSVLLNDIRTFGSYEQLLGEIYRHGRSPQSAFDATLSRMEADMMFDMLPPSKCVPAVFGLLSCARDGLSYDELMRCLLEIFPEADSGECMGSIHICLRQVRAFMARRDGRTDFRHFAFREAASERYKAEESNFHRILFCMFREKCDPDGDGSYRVRDQRALREYAYHLSQIDREKYTSLFSAVSYLNARCSGQYVRELITEMSVTESARSYRDILVRYRNTIEEYADTFPALLWAFGSEEQRNASGFDCLRSPWILTDISEDIVSGGEVTAETAAASDAQSVMSVSVLSELRHNAAAFCIAENAGIAFAFTGRGVISAYETDSMLPLSGAIHTSGAMPLGLCASGDKIAAAFDDDRIELYAYERDGSSVYSKQLCALQYFTPVYGGAAMAFDESGRIWYQEDENILASADPLTGDRKQYEMPCAGELSTLFGSGLRLYGTACVGRGTVLFCRQPDGSFSMTDLGDGDSRIVLADDHSCLVSCPSAGGQSYPLKQISEEMQLLRTEILDSPIAGAVSTGSDYLLIPARQTMQEIWLLDGSGTIRPQGEAISRIKAELLYQDQIKLVNKGDGCFVMISAVAAAGFRLGKAGKAREAARGSEETASGAVRAEAAIEDVLWPDLSRYELSGEVLSVSGGCAAVTGVSGTMQSVRGEQCAGVVFMKRENGRFVITGSRTFPRSRELITCACTDPDNQRYILVMRSETDGIRASAVCGTAEEISSGRELTSELNIHYGMGVNGCISGGILYLCTDRLVLAYDAATAAYLCGTVLPQPVRNIYSTPEGAFAETGNTGAALKLRSSFTED